MNAYKYRKPSNTLYAVLNVSVITFVYLLASFLATCPPSPLISSCRVYAFLGRTYISICNCLKMTIFLLLLFFMLVMTKPGIMAFASSVPYFAHNPHNCI
jgi:hypothetical protein